jgi:hypothetical protein
MLDGPRVEPLLYTGKKVGRTGNGLEKLMAISKMSRLDENRMEHTTD